MPVKNFVDDFHVLFLTRSNHLSRDLHHSFCCRSNFVVGVQWTIARIFIATHLFLLFHKGLLHLNAALPNENCCDVSVMEGQKEYDDTTELAGQEYDTTELAGVHRAMVTEHSSVGTEPRMEAPPATLWNSDKEGLDSRHVALSDVGADPTGVRAVGRAGSGGATAGRLRSFRELTRARRDERRSARGRARDSGDGPSRMQGEAEPV